MRSLRLFLMLSITACVADRSDLDELDPDLANTVADEASWETGDTLHADAPLFARAGANARRVHSLWVAGSNVDRVPLAITAKAIEGHDVRIAVLGPLGPDGSRPVLAADGYAGRQATASATLEIAVPGEHLVVVGAHALARETIYELTATCLDPGGCTSRVDVLSAPKDGALVGKSVAMLLGDMLVDRAFDVEVELWVAPPLAPAHARRIGLATAAGTAIAATIPSSVQAGDDLRLVVREAGGRVLDSGVAARFAPGDVAFARTDRVLYPDIVTVVVSGVVGYYEGHAELVLRAEAARRVVARTTVRATRPGQVGNGFGAFDATFRADEVNAAIDGELLSIGVIDGNGGLRRIACFEYCANVSGHSSCTGGARSCP